MNFTKFLIPLSLLGAVLIGYLSYQLIYNCSNDPCNDEIKPVRYIPTEWIAMGDTTGFGVPQSNIKNVKTCPCGDTSLRIIELYTPLYAEGEVIPPREIIKKEGDGFIQNFYMEYEFNPKSRLKLDADTLFNSISNHNDTLYKIAILDTGLDQFFTTEAIKNNNDIILIDTLCESYERFDNSGHGTAVSVIAAFTVKYAVPNKHYELFSYNVTRENDPENQIDLFNVLCASKHAAKTGVKVINMSFGAYASNIYLENFYNELLNEYPDLYIVCSAGNENKSLDYIQHFPSTLSRDLLTAKIVQVSALKHSGGTSWNYWERSNKWYGYKNIAAKGYYNFGTQVHDLPLQGTSFAAPVVSIYYMFGNTIQYPIPGQFYNVLENSTIQFGYQN